jgi:ectoine hydroxylase-related dioxygenase (phytanoyl-CoA dioxygenase family)
MNHKQELETNGFVVVEDLVNQQTVSKLREEVRALENATDAVRQRKGVTFGIRNLLNLVPSIRNLVQQDPIRPFVLSLAGEKAKVVRGLFFDKSAGANWSVLWHQDLTIAVRQKRDVEGFGPWSEKAGVSHVQPPTSVLDNILALRIHLDDTDERNGALRVVPRSHSLGRISSRGIESITRSSNLTVCQVPAGGIVAMRPLLVHSSPACVDPHHRRVIHLEFSGHALPHGLEWYGS